MERNNLKLSAQFFPPQTPEGVIKLRAVRAQLAEFKPAFFSCTFAAGGSTSEATLQTALEIQGESYQSAPHLTCIGSTHDNIRTLLQRYTDAGIQRIFALRGDRPSGMADAGEFSHGSDLVKLIRQESGDRLHIDVACYPEVHPQARNKREDLLNLKRKVDAGANAAITQFFFNADAYERFIADVHAAGINVPIIPGIMPIASYSKLAGFSERCGAEIPRWMRKQFESYADDSASIRSFGLDVVTALCERLIASGALGLHFFTMNQAGLTTEIWRRINPS